MVRKPPVSKEINKAEAHLPSCTVLTPKLRSQAIAFTDARAAPNSGRL